MSDQRLAGGMAVTGGGMVVTGDSTRLLDTNRSAAAGWSAQHCIPPVGPPGGRRRPALQQRGARGRPPPPQRRRRRRHRPVAGCAVPGAAGGTPGALHPRAPGPASHR